MCLGQKVGMILTPSFAKETESGIISSETSEGSKLMNKITNANKHCLYWRSYRKRYNDVLITKDKCEKYGFHCPMQAPHGTVSRRAADRFWMVSTRDGERIGERCFHNVQTPPGYCYITADVDSQEMWIASLFADMHKGLNELGTTGVSYMTLSGTKEAGTDIHTITAKSVGIDRQSAKVLNYARLYLCGKAKAVGLIGGNPGDELVVDKLWEYTKGKKFRQKTEISEQAEKYTQEVIKKLTDDRGHDDIELKKFTRIHMSMKRNEKIDKYKELFFIRSLHEHCPRSRIDIKSFDRVKTRMERVWKDGVESDLFNYLEQSTKIAEPTLPVLGGYLPKSLTEPISQRKD